MIHRSITVFLSFLTLTLAIEQPPDSDVTWLYPTPSIPQQVTFNTLDTINVSWISAHAPAFLNLACQNNGVYNSTLQLQVPATGDRLVSLTTAASYKQCHFEISVPAKSKNISQSANFDIVDKEDQPPSFWTAGDGGPKASHGSSESAPGKASCSTDKRDAMIGIGIGVAVGVLAYTTAIYTLIHFTRRRKRQRERNSTSEALDKKAGSRTAEWVLHKSSPSGASHEALDAEEKDCTATEVGIVKHLQRESGSQPHAVDAAFGEKQEILSRPVESSRVGFAG